MSRQPSELQQALTAFAYWLLSGEIGEDHEEELVAKFMCDNGLDYQDPSPTGLRDRHEIQEQDLPGQGGGRSG